MKKDVLIKFIQSYYIDSDLNSTIWSFNRDTNILCVKYQTPNKILLGKCELFLEDVFTENFEIGVYDTDKLLKSLKILSDDINIAVNMVNKKIPRSFTISDNKYDIVFMFSDISIINKINAQVTDNKNPEDYAVQIHLDMDVASDYVRATTAFPDALNTYIMTSTDGVVFKIANSLDKSYNSVTMKLRGKINSPVDMIIDTSILKKIFLVHKNDTGVLYISNNGSQRYTKVVFTDEYNINSVYFLSSK